MSTDDITSSWAEEQIRRMREQIASRAVTGGES